MWNGRAFLSQACGQVSAAVCSPTTQRNFAQPPTTLQRGTLLAPQLPRAAATSRALAADADANRFKIARSEHCSDGRERVGAASGPCGRGRGRGFVPSRRLCAPAAEWVLLGLGPTGGRTARLCWRSGGPVERCARPLRRSNKRQSRCNNCLVANASGVWIDD
jgi:hypothetical protein